MALACVCLVAGAAASRVSAQVQTQTPAESQAAVPAPPAGPLSLEQVLQLAEERSESIAIARVGLTRSDGEMLRARSGRYPQLSATGTYERSLANEFQGVFDNIDLGGGGSGSGGTTDGGTTTDGGGLDNLPFGRANTWRATLAFSQTIYSGGRLEAQESLAGIGRQTVDLGIRGVRAQLLFDVTQAYYDAALSERLVTIAEASLEQAGATLRQTQAGFDAGTQPEFEVLRARVSRDNQTPALIRARVTRETALLRLKQMLELPADYDLRLADGLGEERLPPPTAFAESVVAVETAMGAVPQASVAVPAGVALPERRAVAEAETAVRLREVSVKLTEAQRKPSVALTTTFSRIAFPSGFFPTFDRTNWAVGANVTLPILTGGRQRGDEVVARADLEQARIQHKQVQELAALETRSTWAELLAARATWVASAGTVQQAARAYEIADVRYRAGVSTQLELSDARLLLQQAEANRAQAARDLQVARARVALLPNLPLGGGTATAAARGTTTAASPAQSGTQTGTTAAPAGGQQAGTR
jgi:outer membrane protein TolC